MPASNRAALISKAQKVLSKHFTPVNQVERPVLEHLLYACCLENNRYEVADETFARLQESMFDWNEVRVTTIRELSELMKGNVDPTKAANQLKHTLHSVFESVYAFDLEILKKQNLGVSVKQLEGYRGVTPFAIAYVVQNSLGGHAIPLSEGALNALHYAGIATEAEAKAGKVPGLERAVPKTKGAEFSSILHQLGAELAASPFNTNSRAIILEIDAGAKERFPKRGGRKAAKKKEAKKAAPSKKAAEKKTAAKKTVEKKKAAAKPTAKKAAAKKPAAKKPAAKKPATKKPTAKKAAAKKPATKKPTTKKPATKKAAATKKKKATVPKKKVAKKKASGSITKRAAKGKKKSASKQLARRKPR